jgi:hypothetical protein
MYDVLDRRNPIDVVFENDMFTQLCKSWGDAATVTILTQREAAQRARYAAAEAARLTRERLAAMVRPTFIPTRAVPETGPMPLLIETGFPDKNTDQLLAYMATQAEPYDLPTHRFPRLRKVFRAVGASLRWVLDL